MADDAVHYCSICRKPAYAAYSFVIHSKRNGDQELWDIGCAECGEYRIGSDQEAAMQRQSETHRKALRRLIADANGRAMRYCANDGREIALSAIATPPAGTPRVPTSLPSRTPEPRLGE